MGFVTLREPAVSSPFELLQDFLLRCQLAWSGQLSPVRDVSVFVVVGTGPVAEGSPLPDEVTGQVVTLPTGLGRGVDGPNNSSQLIGVVDPAGACSVLDECHT